jgi:hypothetical protein
MVNHLRAHRAHGVQRECGRRWRADLCQPELSGKVITRAEALGARVWTRKSGPKVPLGYGVIGNTTVSGTVILGSSPGIPALNFVQENSRSSEVSGRFYRFGTVTESMKQSFGAQGRNALQKVHGPIV